ncbi:hypothetical protein [Tenacibaculum agarivorans]|uniref:hypothetical protein n=1 Tax=Tenacibaculum agarivorans TaxID=1908389 RepID=UPI00094B9F53|nr:hypothetical protein [Tenacibaculum agarivorans]
MITKNYHLERLSKNQVSNLAEFIVLENFKHHTNQVPKNYQNEVNDIHQEEMKFFHNAEIFVSKDLLGTINGAIRVLKWNYKDILPIEKIFGINPLNYIVNKNVNHIYHIGRFAINSSLRDINLFKKLMLCAIAPVCKDQNNIAFAECDNKLLRVLNLLGIKAEIVGESIHYLGSETIPIALTYDGLINFLNTNKRLLNELEHETTTTLSNRTALLNTDYTYSVA